MLRAKAARHTGFPASISLNPFTMSKMISGLRLRSMVVSLGWRPVFTGKARKTGCFILVE